MSDTWTVRAEGCTMESYSPGNIFASMLAIKNSSDYDIEVRRIYIEQPQGWNTLQSANPFSIYRTNAASMGESLDIIKHDTASAALPAQVKLTKHASVTTTGIVFNRPGQLVGSVRAGGVGGANIFFCGRQAGTAPWNMVHGTYRNGGFVQPAVLREGEGLAVISDSSSSRPRFGYMNAIVRDQASGATYQVIAKPVPTAETDVMLSIFNGSGSGIILEVMRIEMIDVGYQSLNAQDNDGAQGIMAETRQGPPSYRMAFVQDVVGGETLTPFARDTAAAALPAGVSIVKNGQALPLPGSNAMNFLDQWWEAQGTAASTLLIVQQQRLGVLRGFFSRLAQGWQLGNTAFPKYFKTGAVRELFCAPPVPGSGIFVKNGMALAFLHWFKSTSTNNLVQGFTTTNEIDEMMSTLANYTIVIEFVVSVGSGTVLTGGATAPQVGSFIS